MRDTEKSAMRNLAMNCILNVLVTVLVGCVTPPPMMEHTVRRYWEIDVPREELWRALLKGVVEKGVMISIIDKDDNLIVVEETMEGGIFQRFAAETRTLSGGLARVTLLLIEINKVKTGVYISARLQGYTGRRYIHVTSNGNLEKDYFLLLSSNLSLKKTYEWLEEGGERMDEADGTPQGGVDEVAPEPIKERKILIIE